MQFSYPSSLPVSAAKAEIIEAVQHHQVVIISGQTGSGKTTQLPKMLLEIGRGSNGKQIVHTQPRRLAARSVAERIAQELGVQLGQEVGYQVRFTDESSPNTRLRVVTDGILLAQIQRDPELRAYDTIIIDEAHERSLNIDFLLGYLTSLLPKRPDLQLIITSATIDSVKFQEHFEHALHQSVPVIEVSGRTWPVQVLYEPLDGHPAIMRSVPGFADPAQAEGDDDTLDMASGVARACVELVTLSTHETGPRDILVFASGERDIHEFESALNAAFGPRTQDMRRPDAIEIVPLYARLSAAAQHKVFEPHTHQRIVLATNVAETSLTVPSIRYVVDPGQARISRYSKTAKVQRLPIEPISQASANQRSGRCGRVADGIAIRLYSLEDFESRPEFTEPEILRTSLGSVVLHMLSVGVAKTAHDVTHFGFIDPPDMRAVSDGFNELLELRAIARTRAGIRLTAVGRQLAHLPLDVRMGRMIIEAARTTTPNTLAAVLVIVAFLSLQDPRERPDEVRDEADRVHARYADKTSDFLTILNLWDRLFQADGRISNSALRKLCKQEYLNWLRVRQWHDLVSQLRDICGELHYKVGEALPISRPEEEIRALPIANQATGSMACSWDSQGIHMSMLAGLLSMIGMQQIREPKASDFAGLTGAARSRAMKRAQKASRNDYLGARGTRFAIFPASALAKSTPQWVMCSELVETSRLWARYCAQIDPAWAEPLAGSLTRTTYAEPHWSASHGSAIASSTVLLYGLPIVTGRNVQWGHINPAQARDFLIRQGLVDGDIRQRFSYDKFVTRNRQVLEDAQEESQRTRQLALTVSDEDLFDFYQARIPQEVTSLVELGSWWKKEHKVSPHLLDFDPTQVERLQDNESASLDDYPDHWHTVGTDGRKLSLRLSYVYDPNNPRDGVSVHIPVHALGQLRAGEFTWNVPGLLDELILALIKALPKALRVQFVPAPDAARQIRDWIDEHYPVLPGAIANDSTTFDDTESNANSTENSSDTGNDDANANNVTSAAQSASQQSQVGDYPDIAHVFTQAAIATRSATIHPQVINEELWQRLPDYLTMTFVVEHGHPKPSKRGGVRTLGTSKSLSELQQRFAQQAQESARKTVAAQARRANEQGKVVAATNLLQQAGATDQRRNDMLWKAAYDQLKLPAARISSRWLGTESLQLAAAPYRTTEALVADLQLAAVKRLLPAIDRVTDDVQLQEAVLGVQNLFEDAVYDVAHDVIRVLQSYAEIEKHVSGTASLPLLSVLQSIREHMSSLVYDGFIAATPAQYLPRISQYLKADSMRLEKAKTDKNRDVTWAWQAQEAHDLVNTARAQAEKLPAGSERDQAMQRYETVRWMFEEFCISLWAQELGTLMPVSIQRMRKALAK